MELVDLSRTPHCLRGTDSDILRYDEIRICTIKRCTFSAWWLSFPTQMPVRDIPCYRGFQHWPPADYWVILDTYYSYLLILCKDVYKYVLNNIFYGVYFLLFWFVNYSPLAQMDMLQSKATYEKKISNLSKNATMIRWTLVFHMFAIKKGQTTPRLTSRKSTFNQPKL